MSRVADPKAKIALLRAAEEAFAQRGIAGAHVEDIAKEAGLSKGAFYLHFESKEAALDEIVQSWLARCTSLFAEPNEYPDTPIDPDAVLDFCIERDVQLWEFLWQTRTTMRILYLCQSDYAHMFEAFREEMRRRNRHWLHRWRQDGLMRADTDIELAAALMSGAYEQLSMNMIKLDRRPPLERWLEFAQETFVRAFGTSDLIAAVERRNRRSNTGVEVRRSAIGDGDARSSCETAGVRQRG